MSASSSESSVATAAAAEASPSMSATGTAANADDAGSTTGSTTGSMSPPFDDDSIQSLSISITNHDARRRNSSNPPANATSNATAATAGASQPVTPATTASPANAAATTASPEVGLKSRLLSHVENRPDRADLMKRNIMKANIDPHADPRLAGVMSSLLKTQTEDRLAAGLNKRRTVQELVAQGIMLDKSKGTSVQLAQRQLQRQMERDRLASFLTKRPTLDELMRTKTNILEDTMTWTRCTNLSGQIPLPRNCHTMNSFPPSSTHTGSSGNNAAYSKLYLLGGYGTGSTTNSDLLILDTLSDTWIRPTVGGAIPCERYSHTCTSLGDGKLLVFGGFSTNGIWLNDVYLLDTQCVQSFYTKTYTNSSVAASTATSVCNSQRPTPGNSRRASVINNNPQLLASPAVHPNRSPSPHSPPFNAASPPFYPAQHPYHQQQHSHSQSYQLQQQHQLSPSFASTTTTASSPVGHHVQHSTVSMLVWQQPVITGIPPAPRAAHAAVAVGDRIFVFGGNDGATLFNDLHVLDTVNWHWSQPTMRGSVPPPRAGHTMNLVHQRYIVLFGGGTAQGPVNDLFVLDVGDPAGLCWSKPKVGGTPPSPRAGHTTSAFTHGGNQLLVFGGGYLNKVFNDLHLFHFDTGVWSRPADTGTVPSPRAGHTAVVLQSRIYVFAGGDADHVYNDLHILDTAFLRIHQLHHPHNGGHESAVPRPPPLLKNPLADLPNLSLGPTVAAARKTQSAPNSPRRMTSLTTEHARQDSSDGSTASPTMSNQLDLSGVSVDAVASLLSAHAREREDADRYLLARIDATADRVQQVLAGVWHSVEPEFEPPPQAQQLHSPPPPPHGRPPVLDGRDDTLLASLMYTMRAHRTLQTRQLKDLLANAQNQVASELASLRSLIVAQRHGAAMASDRSEASTAYHSRQNSTNSLSSQPQQGTSVFQALAGSSSRARQQQAAPSQAPSSSIGTYSSSHSVPQSPHIARGSSAHSQHPPLAHGIMLGPSVHQPYSMQHDNAAPFVPNMQRSTSADTSSGAVPQIASSRSKSSSNSIVGLPMTAVKRVSISSNPASINASPSPSPMVPIAPGLATPGKKPRKRGNNKFKERGGRAGATSANGVDSSNSSLTATPVLQPMRDLPPVEVDAGMDVIGGGAAVSQGKSGGNPLGAATSPSSASDSSTPPPASSRTNSGEVAPPPLARLASPSSPRSNSE